MKRAAMILCVFLFACAPQSTQTAPSVALIPYFTLTPSATPAVAEGIVAFNETPLPSPTPFTYVVQSGDTMSEIAERFNVLLDDLMAANPNVPPNSMPIGTTLLIPGSPANPGIASTPTPVPVAVKQTDCYPTTDRGLWCFALVRNDSTDVLENVSAQVTLVDSNGAPIASQAAFLPLNILPPASSLPLYVFFAPEIPLGAKPRLQILTATALLPNDARYLPATIGNTSVQVGANGLYARASGDIHLPEESTAATHTWVAAVAYDEYGRVVGVKRWEGGAIQPGTSVTFYLTVSSAGSAIDAVEFVVEARP
jgi:LysM repeat protein